MTRALRTLGLSYVKGIGVNQPSGVISRLNTPMVMPKLEEIKDLFSAIATQSRTLKALQIIWGNLIHKREENTAGARLVLQLLYHCRRLEKFKIMDVPTNCQTILGVWGSKDWKCLELETFELDFYRRQPDDGESSSNEEDAVKDLDKMGIYMLISQMLARLERAITLICRY
ncbi:hypothetical protein KI688_004801 [Linnemannia hyalina]|uniref:Uncharacterized protein n=1 Tax=Linnemannia hyalina TaxID=64524 RepID=A0A9P7XKY9_9FUNG|nr:hypothetical protein KI688_004801 [Linnemannia hyalina]